MGTWIFMQKWCKIDYHCAIVLFIYHINPIHDFQVHRCDNGTVASVGRFCSCWTWIGRLGTVSYWKTDRKTASSALLISPSTSSCVCEAITMATSPKAEGKCVCVFGGLAYFRQISIAGLIYSFLVSWKCEHERSNMLVFAYLFCTFVYSRRSIWKEWNKRFVLVNDEMEQNIWHWNCSLFPLRESLGILLLIFSTLLFVLWRICLLLLCNKCSVFFLLCFCSPNFCISKNIHALLLSCF